MKLKPKYFKASIMKPEKYNNIALKIFIYIILLVVFIQTITFSQQEGDSLSIATYRKIKSEILNEDRTIFVSLPRNYQISKKHYPVLYLLDGEGESYYNYIGLARYLSPQRIPEMIIVGIINKERSRDLFSWKVEGLDGTADDGAKNFLDFLSNELIPFIDKNYRSTNYRTIYGGSAAGHFVIYSLVSKPDLFSAYLASSPAVGYSESPLLNKAESFFKSRKSLEKSFYVYLGKTDYVSVINKIPILESIIKNNTPAGFNWGIKWVDGGHVPKESFYELMLMLYAGWKPVDLPIIIPSGGEFLSGKTVLVEISGMSDPVHYTLNGEEPTKDSPIYYDPIKIDKSTILKSRAIRSNLQEGLIATSQFIMVNKYRPAKSEWKLKSGLEYKYSEHQIFRDLDSISGKILKSGISSDIDLNIRNRDYSYIIEFNGFIKIPKTGQYRFYLTSTDAKLFINNEAFVSNRGLLPKEIPREICLEEGYHAVRIITKNVVNPDNVLKLFWSGPGFEKQQIPPYVWYNKN